PHDSLGCRWARIGGAEPARPASRNSVGSELFAHSMLLTGRVLAAVVICAALTVACPQQAPASAGQVAMLEEDVQLLDNPAPTLTTLRSLGVGVVRLSVRWNTISPSPWAAQRPKGFDATSP